VVIGVLVSAIKDLDTGVAATAGATRPALEPAE
jgi:hypothetical protein